MPVRKRHYPIRSGQQPICASIYLKLHCIFRPMGIRRKGWSLWKPILRLVHVFNDISISGKKHLKIFGVHVHLENQLSFKDILLKKACTKITALWCLNHLVPANTLLVLYKCFVLSHFKYCNSLLIGVNKTLKKKLEDATSLRFTNSNEQGNKFWL